MDTKIELVKQPSGKIKKLDFREIIINTNQDIKKYLEDNIDYQFEFINVESIIEMRQIVENGHIVYIFPIELFDNNTKTRLINCNHSIYDMYSAMKITSDHVKHEFNDESLFFEYVIISTAKDYKAYTVLMRAYSDQEKVEQKHQDYYDVTLDPVSIQLVEGDL